MSQVPAGQFVDRWGGRYYQITQIEALPVFFMAIASSSDLWLFVASNGGLTAGRGDSDHTLFPYRPVDRIYDSAAHTGPVTALWIQRPHSDEILWEPFAAHTPRIHRITRNLYKSLEGDRVWFEEVNEDLRLVFRYGWSTAADYGLVRTAELESFSDAPVGVRLLDGVRNLLVPGISRRLQEEYSCLGDAYKTAELVPGTSLAVFALTSGITDLPVPMESLRATVAWTDGLPSPRILLSDDQLPTFLGGRASVHGETLRRGVRASYLVGCELRLGPGEQRRWTTAVDTNQSAADVVFLRLQSSRGELRDSAEEACRRAAQRLRTLVAAADGLQFGGDETATAHHFANVLFNVMRGGVFVANHDVFGNDFVGYVRQRQRALLERHRGVLRRLPGRLPRAELLTIAATTGDSQLERLALEYLPLTFSRRHGDPSRPWNRFHIRVGTPEQPVLHYEGNWRDIFQNWEALGLSFPEFLDGMIARFLNASTVDGYNPYRLTHLGIEWEVPNPEDPWASIGYWGDHQVIYLVKLLEACARFFPGRVSGWLRRDLFSYAAVPYRIRCYSDLRRDPRHTIVFQPEMHAAIERRVVAEGTDARLLSGSDGAPRHVNLTEKLLLLLLTRLANFVPGGGIWMNTQRPEWNDGNNALVGPGVSVVTLAYLRRLLTHMRDELLPSLGAEPVAVNRALADLRSRVAEVLDRHSGLLTRTTVGDEERRAIVDQLGAAGSAYREGVYASGIGPQKMVSPVEIRRLIELALRYVDHTLRSNRRSEGLYHAYNLIEFVDHPAIGRNGTPASADSASIAPRSGTLAQPPALRLRRLGLMLEGQVAILSSGLLSAGEAAEVLSALRRSALYRPDQDSYLLHPDQDRPGFLERGVIPASELQALPWLTTMARGGDARLVQVDAAGVCRFAPELVNGDALERTLCELRHHERWGGLVQRDAARVQQLYDDVFNHRGFVGRSAAMFGYEGLGSIYWHMVAKLLLAVQENLLLARRQNDPVAERLENAYQQFRNGLGFSKDPKTFGAFPTDPYSHTPAHAGAQQPGMTGQVKEEILTRWGELGVHIERGGIRFEPAVVPEREFSGEAGEYHYVALDGTPAAMPVPAQSLAFTVCGTPVIYRRTDGPDQVLVEQATGGFHRSVDLMLDPAVSAAIFARRGGIRRVEVSWNPHVSKSSAHLTLCENESLAASPWPARSG
jgi:hypothetical protein